MAEEEVIAKVGIDTGNSDKELEKVKDGIEDVGKAQETTAKKSPLLVRGVKSIGKAFAGIVAASGIFVVVQKAFEFLTEAIQRNQKVADAIAIVFDTISIVMNEVVNVLVDVYESVAESTENFDAMGKVISGVITLGLAPLKLAFFGIKLGIQELMLAWEKSPLGDGDPTTIKELTAGIEETNKSLVDLKDNVIEAGADIYNNFSEAITEVSDISTKVVDGIKKIDVEAAASQAKSARQLENQATLAKVALQGLVEENDRLAEKQRQVRDDENATFQDRLKANEELGKILDKQEEDMLRLADMSIAAAQAELDQLDNIENQVALQEALNEKKAIEAQITGFRSEQLTNQVSLENELRDVKNQIYLEGISARQREIEEVNAQYEELFRLAEKSGEDIELLEEQKQEKLRAIKQAAFEQDLATAASLVSSINQLNEQQEANELQAIENKFAGKLKAAEGDAEATKVLEEKQAAEEIKIKKKFAEKKKKGAIAEAVINTISAASKSFAQFGFPLGLVFAGLALAAGYKQVEAIQSAPAFAQGGLVGGGGTGTSDSVNARLSKGESVINARSTRMFKPLLSTINEAGGGRAFAGNDGSGGQTSGVVKAFVVSDDMTNEQDKLTKIRRKATI